jgi:type I restriction enzyme S subunit
MPASPFATKALGDLVTIVSGKRNSSDAVRSGKYPFFTCGKDVLRIDDFEHDREAVLLGGNNANAIFPVFYANGKFTARQRVYVMWSTGATRLSNRFLYYALTHLAGSFTGAARGTTTLFITLPMLKALEVPMPSLQVQADISDVLAGLDERIELLRQANATLESLAKALFKSWFVDFAPVIAKAEGREPEGMDAATAALFPAEFEESALGLIPKGWRAGTVEDLLVLQRGFDLPASQRTEGRFRVLAASGPSGTHHEAMVQGPGVTTGRSGIIGNVFFVQESFWPLNTSLWVKVFKVATPAYAYQFLKTLDLKRLNAGSAVPTLNRNHVHAQPAVLPSAPTVQAYTALASALLERRRRNDEQADTLADLRDTLLPRLISGKLRLPEAQAELEEAMA